jgi:hypothetical protein
VVVVQDLTNACQDQSKGSFSLGGEDDISKRDSTNGRTRCEKKGAPRRTRQEERVRRGVFVNQLLATADAITCMIYGKEDVDNF